MSACSRSCCWNPYSADDFGQRGTCWYRGRCGCHTDERDERARVRNATHDFEALEDTWTR